MLITTLIWDVDGTLFDTYPPIYRSIQLAMRSFGLSVERDVLVRLCQVDMTTCFRVLAEQNQIDLDQLVQRYRDYREQNPSDQQPLYPGLRDFCEWFLEIGGSHYIVTHRDRASLIRLLRHNTCEHWFDDIVAGDDGYPRKPDPTSILALMERHEIHPRSAMFIGDRELDILAARNAGLYACQFGTALTKTPPDMRITQYVQLKQHLHANNVIDT